MTKRRMRPGCTCYQGKKSGSYAWLKHLQYFKTNHTFTLFISKFLNKNMENENLAPFWGASSSFVWKDFGFEFEIIEGKKVLDKTKAVCKICKTKLSYHGSTSTLGNHLRKVHKITSSTLNVDNAPSTSSATSRQSSIKESFGITPPLIETRKQLLDTKVENYVLNKLEPLSTV